ncbi:MAG TPA: DUF3618 domain-containing protein [Pedococcus sp.]|jgi:hypothetical protein
MTAPQNGRPGTPPATAAPTDPDQLRAEIEATRAQLGRTVDELGRRLDVPARARESAARAKDTAVETYRESPPVVIGAAVALVAVVAGVITWRRKRAQRAPRRRKS